MVKNVPILRVGIPNDLNAWGSRGDAKNPSKTQGSEPRRNTLYGTLFYLLYVKKGEEGLGTL